MKKTSTRLLANALFASVFGSLLFLTGCQNQNPLVGTWQSTQFEETIVEFTQDGKFIIYTLEETMNYSFVDQDTVNISEGSVSGDMDFEVNNGVLTLIFDGQRENFRPYQRSPMFEIVPAL